MALWSGENSELARGFKSYRWVYLSLGAFSLVVNMLALVPSFYMLQIYDRVLASRNLSTLVVITLIAAGFYVLNGALEWTRFRVLLRLGNRLDNEFNPRIFTATFAHTLRDAGTNPNQALLDFATVRQFATGPGILVFFDLPWTPIYLVVCFLLHPLIGFVSLAGLLLSLALALVSTRSTEPSLALANRLGLQTGNFASKHLRNSEVIEAMGMLANLRGKWLKMHDEHLAAQSVASDRAGVFSAVSRNFRVAMQSFILGAGAYLVIDGSATAGTMLAASILMGRALGPVDQAIATWRQVVGARAAWERLHQLLTDYPAPRKTLPLPTPKGVVSVEGVVASPPRSQDLVLKGMSFSALPGEVLGVVGPSAAGKSTLARLLVGIWPAVKGKVRLDGADIYTWDKTELGPHVGYLPQDVELFDGSVAENIARFGQLDPEAIVRAAQLAGVHEMVLRLPKGYETPLGANGNALSGGQRQRVALARALYGEPALVVLDEPNSNLDEAGEAALLQVLDRYKRLGKTLIVISQRPSLLAGMDKLLVVRDGMVVAHGPRQGVLDELAHAAAAQQTRAAAARNATLGV